MVVRHYFSVRHSHVIPESGPLREAMLARRSLALRMGIGEFVLSDQCLFMERELRRYVSALDESWRVYRYEDIIFSKPLWVRSLAGYLNLGTKRRATRRHCRGSRHHASRRTPRRARPPSQTR